MCWKGEPGPEGHIGSTEEIEEAIQYGRRYEQARKKVESIVDSYIKECKSNGFTLKEMELLSEVFSERIRAEVERAKYVVTV